MAEKVFTADEVALHNKADDCWLVIGNESNGRTYEYSFCNGNSYLLSLYRWKESLRCY